MILQLIDVKKMKYILFKVMLIFGSSVFAFEHTKALREFKTLAEKGDLNAQIELANAYRQGIGVSQDYKKAVKWFTLAAQQGDAKAQYNLGVMHSFGLGVVPDYEPAVKWYTLAAQQGNALAQYNLARLYYLGHGVSENMIYSHLWAKQASSNGFVMGQKLTELLNELMNATQIEEANLLGRECLKKKFKDC